MIDLEWLKTLQFNMVSGRVTGLAGIGSQWIVFNCEPVEEHPEFGKQIVVKIFNEPRLGFHIREIPPELEIKPTYDASRVNRKLRDQVGNALFDSMVQQYNWLYERIIAILHKGGFEAISSMMSDEEWRIILLFFLKTPALRRRLEDIAFIDSGGDPRDVVMLNGVVDTIEETREAISSWARAMLEELDGVPGVEGTAPEKLCDNPVWIWGGAVLEGFFTSQEMADAAAFITQHFGDPAGWDDIHCLNFQMFAFMSLLSIVEERAKLQRLAEFCNHVGFRMTLPEPEPKSEPEEQQKRQPPADRPLKMPNLAPPWVAPRFLQEDHVDPLAQDPELLSAAATTFGELTTQLAEAAHAAGIAVMLPHPESKSDVNYKPWRSVVSLNESPSSQPPDDDDIWELDFTQRLLVSAQAIAMRRGHTAVPEGIDRLIEDVGYVALGRSHDIRKYVRSNACYSLGRVAAALHEAGYVHGDLQPQNFTFKEDGEMKNMFDLGRACNPGRPLTPLERASDLAVLKKHVSFLEWEAAKLGYRSRASDADEILAYFKQK